MTKSISAAHNIEEDCEVKSLPNTHQKKIIHLLIAHEDPEEANKIINIFKLSGWIVNAHRITSIENLDESLSHHTWNIILAFGHSKLYLPAVIGNAIEKNKTSVRAIFLDNEYSPSNAIQIHQCGFYDYLTVNEHDRLTFIANREIKAQEDHKIATTTQRVMAETNARSQLLMDSTTDAIAYVIDGMIVHSNNALLSKLNFTDAEDLEYQPFIDLVDNKDQSQLKPLLRNYQLGDKKESRIIVNMLTDNKKAEHPVTLEVELLLAAAKFEGEACTQIILRSKSEKADKHTENFNLDTIHTLQGKGSLFFASITSNAVQRKKLGLHNHLRVISHIDSLLSDFIPKEAKVFEYLKESWVIVIPDIYNHEPTDLAAQLCDKVNSTTISEGKQCITPSIAIGISQYGVAGITIENALDQAFKASAEKQMDGKSGYKVFSPKIDNAEGAEALRSALELNRLVIKYQPIIALQNQEKHFYDTIIYIENDAGVIEPANKLIDNLGIEKVNSALDRWLLKETINTLKTGDKSNIQLTIPLTVSAIMDDEFFPWLEKTINESGVAKTAFVFSISAPDATNYESNTLQLITLLKGADLSVCLANANNDYIELIQKLSPNILQLTANLTKKISGEEAESELIKNMISFANEHNAICIASGVNSANELAQLWQTGVGFVQGSYLQSPQSNMDYEFTNIAG